MDLRRRRALRGAALAASAGIALTLPASAIGQGPSAPGSTPAAQTGSSTATTATPPAREVAPNLTEARAIRIARTDPKVAEQRRRYGRLSASAQAKPGTWQVDFYASGTERVQVVVDDATGKVRESWTGYQIAWQMARGYPEQFGHKLNAPYVWLPLAAIFLFGLFDWRRKWRVVHLDLLVLLSFGLSAIFFNAGNIGVSVPLVYPPLVYLLARMLWVGFRGAGAGLRPSAPTAWLAIGGAFLLGFRIALNIADSGVIDVGYAGVIGADRIAHGQTVWGLNAFPSDNPFGDTYGPFNYFAYLPFELILPWHGAWDDLAAAHAAAIVFDLATVGGLLVLGRQLGGTRLGVILGFAWVAYPFTDYALQSNSNDTLIAALLVWALVVFSSPIKRGTLLALATLAKFAPLVLAPLFATGERGLGDRNDAPVARGARGAKAPRARSVLDRLRRWPRPDAGPPRHRARPRHLLRPHRGEPDRPRIAVQRLGSGALSRMASDHRQGLRHRPRAARGGRSAEPVPAADRGAVGRDPDRRPADGRALVLPLHPVVLRLGRCGTPRQAEVLTRLVGRPVY